MAIIGPADLPVVCKLRSDPLKRWIKSHFGWPNVEVELSEDQLEQIIGKMGDWVAGYFPREQKVAVFYTNPLQPTYPLPSDAYWVQEVSWDPVTTRIDDIFSAESYLFNVANVAAVQGILLDYHLLQSYRKFSQKILGTDGRWDVMNEGDGDASKQLIRLYPTPKGSFPVVVIYIPVLNHFRSPQAKALMLDALATEAKIMLGHTRRKMAGMPLPGGGTYSGDGDALVKEGIDEKEKLPKKAYEMGEPLPGIMF